MEQCQFCNNMFGDKKMLRQHQKKTKYCLKIQAKSKEEAKEEIVKIQETTQESKCQFCNNMFGEKIVQIKSILNLLQRKINKISNILFLILNVISMKIIFRNHTFLYGLF